MPSYFVDRRAQGTGQHLVHERTRCPPGCFPAGGDAEYLGELLDSAQAMALARLKYRRVGGCRDCTTEPQGALLQVAAHWFTPPSPGAGPTLAS
ncbi:MAG TPA: hypothetical protein VLK85_30660 [Ramlibacter sp.]|nr:hypothetical protein [Ramlibacter sp.]